MSSPREIYYICKEIIQKKKEMENNNIPEKEILDKLQNKYSSFVEKKPAIYRNIVHGLINLEQFKQFAESAECVLEQTRSNVDGPPKNPVVFD